MASFFVVPGTVSSIGDLTQGKSGNNYIRLELRINHDELLPVVVFEKLAEKLDRLVKANRIHLGSQLLVSGTVHGTKENVNARFLDVSLFASQITDLQADSNQSDTAQTNSNFNTSGTNNPRASVPNNNNTANSGFANKQNVNSRQRVEQQLAKKEKELEERSNASISSLNDSQNNENPLNDSAQSAKNNNTSIENAVKNSKIYVDEKVDKGSKHNTTVKANTSSVPQISKSVPENKDTTNEPNNEAEESDDDFDFNFDDEDSNDSFFN